jgi:hypothetical protein
MHKNIPEDAMTSLRGIPDLGTTDLAIEAHQRECGTLPSSLRLLHRSPWIWTMGD